VKPASARRTIGAAQDTELREVAGADATAGGVADYSTQRRARSFATIPRVGAAWN
jgi:hypothetical protein